MLREQLELLSMDEFIQLYDEAPFELINGERIPLMPTLPLHVWIARLLFRMLDRFCLQHDLGEVFPELVFARTYDENWVDGSRTPDISFYSKAAWGTYIQANPDWGCKPILIVPELVVEVVSKNDSYTHIRRKVQAYLKDGVQLIWVVDPWRESVDVYQGKTTGTLDASDTLTGGTVLPDFSVALKDLFAEARADVGDETS